MNLLHADILVVDDNPANVQLLLDMLEDHGYEKLEGCSLPLQAMERICRQPPDLLLLDIRMPELSGHQILTRLRERFGEEAPPVIVLTAQTDQDTRMRSLELGARDFLTKPFHQGEVLQRIENVLQVQSLMNLKTSKALLLEQLVEERTAELQKRSVEDPLTSLPNRRALLEELQHRLDNGQPSCVLFLAFEGIDDLARLNGYELADSAVLAIRDRLQALSGGHFTMAVWNSSEWVLLTASCPDNDRIADDVIHALGQSFDVGGVSFHLTSRIGISDTAHSQQADQLVRMAALAVPPENNSWGRYSFSLEDELLRRTAYREALHKAIVQNELFLLYQPKISVAEGRVASAEALLRWRSEELGLVPPDFFIPLAESSGEILEIGDWVIQEAIRQLSEWMAAGVIDDDFHIALNVSAQQLMQADFASSLISRIRHAGLNASCIEVEVTETGLMQDMDHAMQQLRVLSQAGVSVAIDDFGTGYSSLSYLKSLPVSVLKIDRVFVADLDTSEQDRNLAETVIQMAENFGFTTVAEGVEKEEHVNILAAMGCGIMQGFYYSPPLPADIFITFVREFEMSGQ